VTSYGEKLPILDEDSMVYALITNHNELVSDKTAEQRINDNLNYSNSRSLGFDSQWDRVHRRMEKSIVARIRDNILRPGLVSKVVRRVLFQSFSMIWYLPSQAWQRLLTFAVPALSPKSDDMNLIERSHDFNQDGKNSIGNGLGGGGTKAFIGISSYQDENSTQCAESLPVHRYMTSNPISDKCLSLLNILLHNKKIR
jgi:hypothetical protein